MINLALGVIIGILLTICVFIFSNRNPNFLAKVESKIPKKQGYIIGTLEENESIINNNETKTIK